MPDSSTALFFAGLAAAVVAARYFLASPSSPSRGAAPDAGEGRTPGGRPAPPREVTEDMISIVSVLVPHMSREAIAADLHETRSVEATTVRLLEQQKAQKPPSPELTRQQDEEILNKAEEPKPANWIDDRNQRELHMKQQREKMLAKARLRTMELAKQEQS